MNINNQAKALMLTGLLTLTMGQAKASEALVPEINPTSACLAQDVKTPLGNFPKYRYLRDENCKAIFVLPKPKVVPEVEFEGLGRLNLCKAVNENISRQNDTEKTLSKLRDLRVELVEKLVESESDAEAAKYEKKIAFIKSEVESLKNDRNEDKVYLDNEYGRYEGGLFHIYMDSGISAQDKQTLSEYNEYPVVLKDDKGNDVHASMEPVVVDAPISESYYSFKMRSYTPENPIHPSIMETDIPGLEKLKQVDSTHKYTHVQGGNELSGEAKVNLPTVCERIAFDENDKPYMPDENKSKMFAVNRTMIVKKRFKYGFTATLKRKEVAKKLAEDFIVKGSQGRSVTQVFDQDLSGHLSSMFKFDWNEEYATNNTIVTSQQVLDLRKEAYARLVSDYYSHLVKSGKLTPLAPIKSGTGEPKTTEEFAKGWGCGPVNVGGVIFDHNRCGAYHFTLTTYHSGITDKEIENSLTLKEDLVDGFEAQSWAPFTYTTAFVPPKKNDDNEEGEE